MERTIIPHRDQTNGTESAWYCLRSHPKHERIAAAHVRLLENVIAFCPQIRFKRGRIIRLDERDDTTRASGCIESVRGLKIRGTIPRDL